MNAGAGPFFAVVLALSAVLSAIVVRRSAGKRSIDLAAVLQAALAVTIILEPLAGERVLRLAVLAALTLAPVFFALACFAVFVQTPSRLQGAIATFAGLAVLALAAGPELFFPVIVALLALTIAIAVLALGRWRQSGRDALLAFASMLVFDAGAAAFVHGGTARFCLFAAAAQLGFALACSSGLPVKDEGWLRRPLAIRGKR